MERQFSDRLSEAAHELADHFEKCADWPRAIKYLRLAADRARRLYAHREATVLLQQALELATRLPDSDRVTAETEILEAVATIDVASFDDGDFPLATCLIPRRAQSPNAARTADLGTPSRVEPRHDSVRPRPAATALRSSLPAPLRPR
jgi:hypothetical protein